MLVSSVIVAPQADGKTVQAPATLLIRFMHTPATKKVTGNDGKEKEHVNRVRSCTCEIAVFSPAPLSDKSVKFSAKSTGEGFVTPLVHGKSTCLLYRGDVYCRAYGRLVSLERALHYMFDRKLSGVDFHVKHDVEKKTVLTDDGLSCPFQIVDKTFRDCIATLRKNHPHGMKAADALRTLNGLNL